MKEINKNITKSSARGRKRIQTSLERNESNLDINDIELFIKEFETCWASYTHSLFKKLMKNSIFQKVFSLFYSSLLKIGPEKDTKSPEWIDYRLENLKKFRVMKEKPELYLKKIEEMKIKLENSH